MTLRTSPRRGRPLVVMLALLLALTACSQGLSEDGEPLTLEQSETLASARFRLGAQGPFTVELTIGAEDDLDRVQAHLTVDPTEHIAWGLLSRGPIDLAVTEAVQISPSGAAVLRDGRWEVDQGALHGSLVIVLSLTADRPENAQLLRQSDARHLGTIEADGRTLDVYRLPGEGAAAGHSRLWLDEDGAVYRLDSGSDALVVLVGVGTPEERPEDGPLATPGQFTDG